LTVYRGLALSPSAIQDYKEKRNSGEIFNFSSYTSTSLNKQIALKFTQVGDIKEKVGVLFKIKLHMRNDNDLIKKGKQVLLKSISAFPEE